MNGSKATPVVSATLPLLRPGYYSIYCGFKFNYPSRDTIGTRIMIVKPTKIRKGGNGNASINAKINY